MVSVVNRQRKVNAGTYLEFSFFFFFLFLNSILGPNP